MAEYNPVVAAILRFVRAAVAIGLPQLIGWLAGNPDPKWSLLAPVLMAIGKYLRDVLKWDWLPV